MSAAPRLAFVLGAPRSGTTWLARSLGAHPQIAALYETHLFNAYLHGALGAWRTHMEVLDREASRFEDTGEPPRATIGLPYVLTEAEFQALLSDMVRRIAERAVATKVGAEVVVEKTPSHSRFVDDIERVTDGEARYIHIIRNGYDVVSSLRRSSRGWGSSWAPADVPTASRTWVAGVRAARQAAALGDRYLELRYEALVADPQQALAPVLAFLGVEATPGAVRQALSGEDAGLILAGEAAARFGGPPPEPAGFRRGKGVTGLGERDCAVVEQFAGDLLDELGYRDGATDVRSGRRLLWRGTGRLESAASRARRVISRLPRAVRSAD